MPNYNTQLQTHNSDLQTVLQTLQTKASGVKLPDLTNPANASELLSGKELIDQEGKILTGSMPNNGSIALTMDGIDTKTVSIPGGYTSGGTVSLDNTIDEEVSEQSDLIAQIKNAANNLPEVGSGSGESNIETCAVRIEFLDPSPGDIVFYYTDVNFNLEVLGSTSTEQFIVPKGTIVVIEHWTSSSAAATGAFQLFYSMGYTAYQITDNAILKFIT